MTSAAATGTSGRTSPRAWRDADSAIWPIIALGVLLAVQAAMIPAHAVNWDESLHYGVLHDLASGEAVGVLQSLYLRPYLWLAGTGNTIDNIVLARWGQWLFEAVAIASIYVVARRFADRTSAVLAALAYLSAGYVLQNGFALRADPMVTAVLMSCLAILTRCPLRWPVVLAAGMLGGLAPMLSIKAVLYAPAFAGILWMRWNESGRSRAALARIISFAIIAAAAFAAIYAVHAAAIGAPGGGTERSFSMANSAANRMFFIGRPNNLGALVYFMMTAVGTTILILAAPFGIARHTGAKADRIALTGLLLPVLTPFFYENTAAYFYVFMLAPVAAACAVSITLVRRVVPALAISGLLLAFAVPLLLTEDWSMIERQRRLAAELGVMWDKPVAYFDHADVAPALNKRNPFQTPWGYRGYLANGAPIYREAMEREPVPLFIPNWWTFRDLLSGNEDLFLPADAKALRENYVPFNGPIWLAGKDIPPGSSGIHEFLVPGPYTLHGGSARIDGREMDSGAVTVLTRGFHRIETPDDGKGIRLVWGNRITSHDRLDFTHTWVPF